MANVPTESELGERLTAIRKKLGLSQEFLAQLLNHDQTYVSKVETGRRQLSVVDFCKWCEALNITQDEVTGLLFPENNSA